MKPLLTLLTIIGLSGTATAQTQSYFFNNSFTGTGGGPTLTELLSCGATAGAYDTATINTVNGVCTGGPQTVFEFMNGGGFSHSNGFITGTYTIDIFFQFNELIGYNRIIDFKNSATDVGLYTLGDCLNFFPNGNSGTCPYFLDSTFYLITLVRDDVTDSVDVFVNGTLFVSNYYDAAGTYASASTATPIILFRDDNSIGCETGNGSIRYFSLKAAISTPAEVAATYFNICGIIAIPPPLAQHITNFGAVRMEDGNMLTWSAAGEEGTLAYEAQRSSDGKWWETIGSVTPTGNATYSFKDVAPLSGYNYYRLRSLYRDGTNALSKTAVLTAAVPDGQWTLAGNPAYTSIELIQMGGWETTDVSLYNMLGARVWHRAAANGHVSISTAGIPGGVYTVVCRSADNHQVLRVQRM